MSTFDTILDDRTTTDALFQAYCQAIESALLASGFLEVAPDTGQLNLATVARPATNTFAGYRIYRAKDALAATKPMYVKVEYGVAASQSRPKLQTTVGTGSNGSGTLTGQVQATQNNSPTADGSGAMLILGGGGEHDVCIWQRDDAGTTFTLAWWFGRLLDPADGSATDPLLFNWWSNGSSSIMQNSYGWSDGTAGWLNVTSPMAHFPDMGVSSMTGGNVNTVLLYQGFVYRNAKTWVFPGLVGKATELPFTDAASSAFSVDIWGGSHTFLPIPYQLFNSGIRLAMLWE